MNIAVIGIGKLGQRHLDKWLEIEGVNVVGIIARDKTELKRVSRHYHTNYYQSIEALLEHESVDLIDICTPTHTHSMFIKQVAQAGVHVICEKPIALTFSEAQKAMEVCEEANVELFIAHTLAFFPIYEQMTEYLKQNVIGDHAEIHMARGVPYPADQREWYVDEEKSGGLFLDLGVHEFAWILATYGDVKSVQTRDVRYHEVHETIIYGVVELVLRSGVIATIELSWDEPAFRASFEAKGSTGIISYNHTNEVPHVTYFDEIQDPQDLFKNLSTVDPYVRQLSHFIHCLQGQVEPKLLNSHAAQAVQIAELARRSVTEGIKHI